MDQEQEIKSNLRHAISDFCRWRVNQGLCDDGNCFFCEVNRTFDMARDDDESEEKEPLEKLFRVGDYLLYVQYTKRMVFDASVLLDADDPVYDFDYTIFDGKTYADIEGGMIGQYTDWDLQHAAAVILANAYKCGILPQATGPVEVDIEQYRNLLKL